MINHPRPLLTKEGNHAAIFMHRGEPKDHGICALFDAEWSLLRVVTSRPESVLISDVEPSVG